LASEYVPMSSDVERQPYWLKAVGSVVTNVVAA
jgi:hypothetical protein